MARDTGIEWTTHTWNPWRGCRKVSAGCKHCYMFREQEKRGVDPTKIVRASDRTFNAPLTWETTGEPTFIFTCSYSDFFLPEAKEWRDEAWQVIRNTPWFTYQILTKRPQCVDNYLPKDWGDGYPNVWLGVTVEGPDYFYRIGKIIRTPAVLHFVSFEPLIDKINKAPRFFASMADTYPDLPMPKWAIIGGESGRPARPMKPRWALDLMTDLMAEGVAVFIKQLGSHWATSVGAQNWKGANPDEWPSALRVREMPE